MNIFTVGPGNVKTVCDWTILEHREKKNCNTVNNFGKMDDKLLFYYNNCAW